MSDVVLKVSGKMREIEIDPVSVDDGLEEVTEADFKDADEADFGEDTSEKVVYQIWLLGRGEYDDANDFTYCIDEYEDVNEAIKCWNFFTENDLKVIKNKDENFYIPADVYSVDLVVEEVAVDNDGNEECFNFVREENIKIK